MKSSQNNYTISLMTRVLIFGATGALGSACSHEFQTRGWEVVEIGRDLKALEQCTNISAVVWAQGINFSGTFEETTQSQWEEILEANLFFITKTLRIILSQGILATNAHLVLLSSIWQDYSRSNKSAYTVSKSAVGGLVRALSVELGEKGFSVNAILPGIIDTPMTRSNLSKSQIEKVTDETPSRLLVNADQVAKVCYFLSSEESTGINGQSITVDGGWTVSRYV